VEKKHIKDDELFFYLTGDLDSDTITGLEKHVQDCQLCRDRLAQERTLYTTIRNSDYPVPAKDELKRMRKKLKLNLKQTTYEKSEHSFSLKETLHSLFSTNFALKFAAGGTLFLVGLLLGFTFSGSSDTSIQELLNSNTTRFEKISFQSENKSEVMLVVEQTSQHILRLSADDPRLIQAAINILKYDERDNMRLKAVKILQYAEKKKAVEFALVQSLQADPNPGIRLHAIQILKKFPLNQKIKDVLVSVLFKDSNSGVRYEAQQCLDEFKESTDFPLKKNMTI
jgi:hypothetical protein